MIFAAVSLLLLAGAPSPDRVASVEITGEDEALVEIATRSLALAYPNVQISRRPVAPADVLQVSLQRLEDGRVLVTVRKGARTAASVLAIGPGSQALDVAESVALAVPLLVTQVSAPLNPPRKAPRLPAPAEPLPEPRLLPPPAPKLADPVSESAQEKRSVAPREVPPPLELTATPTVLATALVWPGQLMNVGVTAAADVRWAERIALRLSACALPVQLALRENTPRTTVFGFGVSLGSVAALGPVEFEVATTADVVAAIVDGQPDAVPAAGVRLGVTLPIGRSAKLVAELGGKLLLVPFEVRNARGEAISAGPVGLDASVGVAF